jgi:DNA-directed RNA polymerase subunit F
MSIDEKKPITVAEAKKILEENLEDLDPLQRRVHDYTVRFTKLDADQGEKMVDELIEAGVERPLAVQIVNALPESIGEVRTFLGRRRIIAEDLMTTILGIIEKYRPT